MTRQVVPHRVAGTDRQKHGQNGEPERRALLDQGEIGGQGDRSLDRHRAGKLVGGQDFFGIQTKIACVHTQEGGNISSTREQVEATLLDSFDVVSADANPLLDVCYAEAPRLTLVVQKTTDGAAWCGLSLNR